MRGHEFHMLELHMRLPAYTSRYSFCRGKWGCPYDDEIPFDVFEEASNRSGDADAIAALAARSHSLLCY